MSTKKKINNVSAETENAMLRKSAYGLPNRPSQVGMRAEDVKKAFYSSLIDGEASLLSELKRIVTEANDIFDYIYNDSDNHITDSKNPHKVTKNQVGLSNVDNTSDLNKPVSTIQQAELDKKINYTDVRNDFNSEDTNKPLSAKCGNSLNKRIVENKEKIDLSIKDISLDSENGILTIVRTDDTSFKIDLPLEFLVKSGSYNPTTKSIELILDNNTKITIPVADLVNEYFSDGTTISMYVDSNDNNKIKFKISDTYKNKILKNESDIKTLQNEMSGLDARVSGTVAAKIDASLSETSENAVQNKVITKKLKEVVNSIPKHTISLVPSGTEITANINLNTINYIKVGLYYCSTNATVGTLTNCPVSSAFMMEVYSPLSTTNVGKEETEAWIYRLRKIVTLNGDTYYQFVNSNETAGVFTYGSWVKVATLNDGSLVKTSGGQDIDGYKKFLQDLNIGPSLTLLNSPNGGIEIGRRDGTTSTPYIDFHTDGNPISSTDYNVRLMASGGTKGTNGDGTLNISAGAVTLNGSKLISQNKFSMRKSSTVGKFYYNTGDSEKEVQLELYPVGSIYLTVSTSPLNSSPASWIGGTWERLPEGYALWTASTKAGSTIVAGLPNITGSFAGVPVGGDFAGSQSGAFASSTSSGSSNTWGSSNAGRATINFNANSGAEVKGIYGTSTTVQPPAYKVYAWKRIS